MYVQYLSDEVVKCTIKQHNNTETEGKMHFKCESFTHPREEVQK